MHNLNPVPQRVKPLRLAVFGSVEQAAEKCFAVKVLKGHGFSAMP
jgi:hypothetical protein